MRNGKMTAPRRAERTQAPHPAIAKLAVALREYKEAIEQQAATADILRALARSSNDPQPIFRAIVENAHRLCGAIYTILYRYDGKMMDVAASKQPTAAATRIGREVARKIYPAPPQRDHIVGCVILEGQPIQSVDLPNDARFPANRNAFTKLLRRGGTPRRAVLVVPLLLDGTVLGAISVGRAEAKEFTKKEIRLLQTFADQAVIAIQNAAQFREIRERNAELAESLQHQGATTEVLRIVSRSLADAKPVFDAILAAAMRLFPAFDSTVWIAEGDRLVAVARGGATLAPNVAPSVPIDREHAYGILILEGRPLRLDDVAAADIPDRSALLSRGRRALLMVPMIRDGQAIGALSVSRTTPTRFSDKQVALFENFADQAVIAIENARLFNETKEALERQTATSDVLRVMSASPTDVQPVFDSIAERAAILCQAKLGFVARFDGKLLHMAAFHGASGKALETMRAMYPMDPRSGGSVAARVIRTAAPVQVADVFADAQYAHKDAAQTAGFRSVLGVPLVREGQIIGALIVVRAEAGVFPDRQVELLRTFAAQAVIAIENVRLFNETKEALEHQTATSDVLGVISSSPTDIRPVFDAILKSATQLCEAHLGLLNLFDGENLRTVAQRGATGEFAKLVFERGAYKPEGGLARAIAERRPVHIPDLSQGSAYLARTPNAVRFVELGGARTFLGVPLLKEGKPIGAFVIYRPEVRPFTEKQIGLLSMFASQAVIAIENVRLFNETKEALEQQTATAEILRVISSSPEDIQPVFDSILEHAMRLCDAGLGTVGLYDGKNYQHVAQRGGTPEYVKFLFSGPFEPNPDSTLGRIIAERQPFHVADYRELAGYRERRPRAVATVELGGARTYLAIPMLKEGQVIGGITIRRSEVRPFTQKQIDLVSTFANQAVIAIENVRLFNETKEALEQQTAISEVLRVISSSPTDVKPVLEAVAARATRICEANDARIFLVNGAVLRHAAGFGDLPITVDVIPMNRGSATGRAVIDGSPVHIQDINAESRDEFPVGKDNAARTGWSTVLAVPLMREQRALGAIVLRRMEVRPFSEKQIALLQTFADQAAIAIENVRLFNETKEALDQQTSTAEVLKTISRSTFDLDAVLQTLLDNATRLSGAACAAMWRSDADGNYLPTLTFNYTPDAPFIAQVRERPIRPGRDSIVGRVLLERTPIHVPDVLADPEYRRQDLAGAGGFRTVLVVPMLRDGEAIGVISLTKGPEVNPFTDKQMELVTTFADQAVIAIENVRLFKEIEEKSAQLEVANQHKSDFLANMSHELRTPLNAIIGFSEALMERMFGELNDKQSDYLKDIHESGKHLLSLINDILDLSKIEAGRMELELGSFDLPSALSNAMTLIRERAQRHAIELGLEVDPRLGQFQADERKFKQIMLNLLSNAVKFTPDGGRVDVCVKKDTDKIEIAVRDTGIGIAPEDQAAVFEEFKQVGKDSTRRAEGTGLGLALTKRFVELHGGAIRLESVPGKGSTFSFTLPVHHGG
jgi:GAF domain-containing protein